MKVVPTFMVLLLAVALAAASTLSEGCSSRNEKVTSSPLPPNSQTAPSTNAAYAATATPQTVSATELSDAPSGSLLFEPGPTCVSSLCTVMPDGTSRTMLNDSLIPNAASGFSPDGELLAYVSSGNSDPEADGVYVMSSDGSNPAPVATGDAWEFVSWTPKGKILYAKADTVGIDLAGYDYWTVNLDGSERTRISQMNRCDDPVGWSPHGDSLLLCQCAWDRAWMAPSSCSLSIVNEVGSVIRTIIPEGDAVFGSPRWSPDGSHILFIREGEHGGLGELVVMDADGSNQHAVLGSRDQMDLVERAEWSPDGTEIAAAHTAHDGQIVVVSAASGAVRTVVGSGTGNVSSLAWSPDGKELLYGSRDRPRVHVVDVSGETGEVVIDEAEEASWSPDGSRIVFTSSTWDCKRYVWWTSPDGSKRARLDEVQEAAGGEVPPLVQGAIGGCERGQEEFSCLSPDGASEAIVDNGTLKIVDRTDGQTREVQLNGASAWNEMPVWSSDGGRIALYVKTYDTISLFTVDVRTEEVRSIAAGVAPFMVNGPLIAWSPDDSYIYYSKESYCMQGGCTSGFLYRSRSDGSGEQRVVDMRIVQIYGFKP